MKVGILIFLTLLLTPLLTSRGEEIKLSLDKLFSLKVTSVSGTAMDLKKSPAAIYVITSKDFETQGHLTLADALRAVPGFHVAKIDSNKFAISARGFSGRFANKLLVLIDGRSVYTPLFSGVFWEIQDMILDDIDRVEVIRGPGATLWGANAVNGVINIVTKGSRETQGGNLKLGIGSIERGYGHIRYGAQLTDDLFFRISAKGFNRGSYNFENGGENNDSWESFQFNLRSDWYVTDRDTLTFFANTNNSLIGTTGTGSKLTFAQNSGGFDLYSVSDSSADSVWVSRSFQLEWNRAINSSDGFTVKSYYDYTENDSLANPPFAKEVRHTIDFDFRHWTDWNDNNSFIWGLNYRVTSDNLQNTDGVGLLSKSKRLNTYSMFLQNTYRFAPKWSLMIGTKFEYNDQTQFETQPSARLTYEYTDDTTFWASFSRAVRKPGRHDDDMYLKQSAGPMFELVPGQFIAGELQGNTDTDSEELVAWELGMRQDYLSKKLSVDLAAFYFDYSHLSTFVDLDGNPLDLERGDDQHGESYGAELSLKYKFTDNLDIMVNYSFFKLLLHGPDERDERGDARNLLFTAIHYKITKNISWYTTVYYSDNVTKSDISTTTDIHNYFIIDTGLAWQVTDKMKLSVWAKNLTDPHQLQSSEGIFQPKASEVPRSFFVEMCYKF